MLKEVAQRLQANLRPSDTAAQIAGDEFVLILTAVASDEWRAVLERIAVALQQPIQLKSGAGVRVSGTFGVVLSSPHKSDVDILDRADQVMLDGKKNGKDRIFWVKGLLLKKPNPRQKPNLLPRRPQRLSWPRPPRRLHPSRLKTPSKRR